MARAAGLLAVAAILYFAREVLIPLALAILLAFLLAPVVRRVERLKIGRVPAVVAVVLLGFAFMGAVAWVAANQAISLAAKLPEYRENVVKKIRAVRAPGTTDLGKAAEAIKELEQEAAPSRPPLPVKETPGSPLAAFAAFVAPFAKPLGSAFAVLIFTILMLVHRENMRERLIALIGAGRITVTTQAMAEASVRVSSYLFTQLVVNAAFGIPFGIALYFIGVPNAMLWGLLATVLRFIPYAGVWLAVAMPALLAFAIADGWSMLLWTVGVFLLLELVLVYAVEPWAYGRSAGLSPIAIIAAALLWTWLWGPIGLLLATPLTVCMAVMGRYIPEMGFLNMLLGVEPVLTDEARFYQRLVALDHEEVTELAERHAAEHGLASLLEAVLMPAVGLMQRDRNRGAIDERREQRMFALLRRIVEETEEEGSAAEAPSSGRRAVPISIVAAHDEADHLAALILARVLPRDEFRPEVAPFPLLAAEAVDAVAGRGGSLVVVSAVPPHAATQASYLARRLRQRLPHARIVVGLWTSATDIARARERLRRVGADEIATQLSGAVSTLRQLAVPLALQAKTG